MNLKAVSVRLNLGAQYTRKLITSGRIPSKLVPISEGSATMRHDVSEADLEAFLKEPRKAVAARRDDGRSRFILFATPEEIAAIHKAVPTAIVEKQKSQSVVAKAKIAKMTNAMIEDEIKSIAAKADKEPLSKAQQKRLSQLKSVKASRQQKANI